MYARTKTAYEQGLKSRKKSEKERERASERAEPWHYILFKKVTGGVVLEKTKEKYNYLTYQRIMLKIPTVHFPLLLK